MALGSGIIFINLYPLYFLEATLFAVIIGSLTGIFFGSLFDYQTLLTGYINGLMMGIMAPMVGSAASEGVYFLLFIELFILSSFVLIASLAHRG